jgi:hypothetical protein
MKRALAIGLAAVMVLAVGAAPVAARRPHPAELVYRVSQHAQPGDWFRVAARVKHPQRDAAFSVSAVVTFRSGATVTLDLERRGDGFAAVGRVPVSPAEYGGAVPVDFTVTYGDGTTAQTVNGNVDGPPAPINQDE